LLIQVVRLYNLKAGSAPMARQVASLRVGTRLVVNSRRGACQPGAVGMCTSATEPARSPLPTEPTSRLARFPQWHLAWGHCPLGPAGKGPSHSFTVTVSYLARATSESAGTSARISGGCHVHPAPIGAVLSRVQYVKPGAYIANFSPLIPEVRGSTGFKELC
jgi:hypothetical protein